VSSIDSGGRRPVHVVYGGAHRFKADTCNKLGGLARRSMIEYAPDAAAFELALGLPRGLGETVYARVIEKLDHEPVEDFRIDFEDGFGVRPDEEEDRAAEAAASETAAAMAAKALPAFFGIRIKSLSGAARPRAVRTLDRFLKTLLERSGGRIPGNFAVTLPKITAAAQVRELMDLLAPYPEVRIELMIETPESVRIIPEMIAIARGRAVAAHFGAYDYTAALGITAAHQSLSHPACVLARSLMQLHFAGSGIALADGGTIVLPIPRHRTPPLSVHQILENEAAVRGAWKLHYDAVRESMHHGFYQSWDLHPAQLPARFAAVYAFFLEGLEEASRRLKNFLAQSAQATQTGGVFDDAATGHGLMNYFRRAVDCGAIPASDLPALTGLSAERLREACPPR